MALLRLFKRDYMFRPGFMKATQGTENDKELLQVHGMALSQMQIPVPGWLL